MFIFLSASGCVGGRPAGQPAGARARCVVCCVCVLRVLCVLCVVGVVGVVSVWMGGCVFFVCVCVFVHGHDDILAGQTLQAQFLSESRATQFKIFRFQIFFSA